MLPDKSDSRWRSMLLSKTPYKFKSMLAGLYVGKHIHEIIANPTEARIAEGINGCRDFFQKYEATLQDDLKAIFG